MILSPRVAMATAVGSLRMTTWADAPGVRTIPGVAAEVPLRSGSRWHGQAP